MFNSSKFAEKRKRKSVKIVFVSFSRSMSKSGDVWRKALEKVGERVVVFD
jgi:hypothetical protein